MKQTKIKVLITGAGGFLGSYIAKELINKNDKYEVHSFSRSKYPFLKELGVVEHLGDLKNEEDVTNALSGMDAIIHTASMVGIWGRYEDFYSTNITGTLNILNAMKTHKIKKLVYTSTPSVSFDRESLCGVDEKVPTPKSYLTHYAKTKSIAEKMVLAENSEELNTVALRPHLIFGPGDLNLIPRVIKAQEEGRLKIIGDGNNLVDVTYVENAASAHIMALEKLDRDHPISGKAYFLGQGPIKLWDFTNEILVRSNLPRVEKKIPIKIAYFIGFLIESFLKIFHIYNIDPPMTRFVALQLGKSHYFSHKNLENDLGFKPHISIDEGINLLINHNR